MSTIGITATELLQPGHWLLRENCLYEICAWDKARPLQVEVRLAETGERHIFALSELFAPDPPTQFAATAAELMMTTETAEETVLDEATLPAHLLQKADQILQTVERVEAVTHHILGRESHHGISKTAALQRACQELPTPIALSTYYNYRQRRQACQGDRAQIAMTLHRNTYGKTRMNINTMHFMDTIVQRFYRSNPPLRKQTVHNIAHQIWHHNRHWWLNVAASGQEGFEGLIDHLLDVRQTVDEVLANPAYQPHLTPIQLPSRTWFYGYVQWFDSQPGLGEEVYKTRHGEAAWEANFRLFDQFAATATLPLQYVFADHYQLDVLHVDDEYRELLSRLWLTVLIDAYSRAVLGLYLSYEAPRTESIQGVLRQAIWPKTGLDQLGIHQAWDCFGVPQRLFLDNAWAHHSHSLETLTRALAGNGQYTAMELVFRPPYQARYGGLVERIFGNLCGQMREQLSGAILQPDQRDWHNASEAACLLYQDVERIIYQIIVDYMHTPHRELGGLTPHERWVMGMKLMTPVPPPLTPQLARYFWRLHPQTRAVRRMGIGLFGLHYRASHLSLRRGPNQQGKERHFRLRYDPTDISRLAVFEEGQWLGDAYAHELRLANGQYEKVSLWELKMAKTIAQQQHGDRPLRPASWLVHLLETRELIAQRQAEKKQIRRKVEELKTRRQKPLVDTPAPTALLPPTVTAAVTTAVDTRGQLLALLEEEL